MTYETNNPGTKEPDGAFPYTPPSEETQAKFSHVFSLRAPLKDRFVKTAFDKAFSATALLAAAPIVALLYLGSRIEGIFRPASRGDFFISYNAVSSGQVFPKYKIRVIKSTSATPAAKGDWRGYAAEWSPEDRTFVGNIIKHLYLDELPQLFNVLVGHMSMVGPRPLAVHHYERDLAQGNVSRRVIKAGLLGPTQALKGTSRFGNSEVEYEYIDNYMRLSPLGLLWYDLTIIARCLGVVVEAKGL
ncbi:MAG: sugar transferase [Candidatus Nitricoxidivorans perseverans]|uniref:Sugar transferase n=1 Tax=Candidatus Nitricoxidivorans perseverans TaxID=2975601 RepID=A0AA49FP09_9PROT|nr:MAG: sugar transferase [Candidatus Nitricoxidivorans perseverans]